MAKRITKHQVRRYARRHGLTFQGGAYAIAGGEPQFAERDPGSLKKQAHREIQQAYKPAEKEYNRREGQIRALDTKRQGDEATFRTWLTQQQATLRSQAQGRDQELRGVLAQGQKDLQGRLQALHGSIQNNEGAGPAPQSAAGTAAETATTAAAQGTSDRIANLQRLGVQQGAATDSNAFAYQASLSNARAKDTIDQLHKLADQRGDLALKQSAAEAGRLAGLLDTELKKGQLRIAASQFGQKLNVDMANIQADNSLALTKAQRANMEADRKFQLDVKKEGRQAAKDAYKQRKHLGEYKPSGGSGAGKASPKQIGAYVNDLGRGKTFIESALTRRGTEPNAIRPDPRKDAAGRHIFDLGDALLHARALRGQKANKYAIRAVNALVLGGLDRAVAQESVWHWLYPGKPLPQSYRKARRQAINAKPH